MMDGEWVIAAPLANRLLQKSGIGKPISGGSITVLPEEIMFCHWYRHLPLPEGDWLEGEIKKDETFLAKSVFLDIAKQGGEVIRQLCHLSDETYANLPSSTYGLRWHRTTKFQSDKPSAAVRWFMSGDVVDWQELIDWQHEVSKHDLLAEVYVVDEEMDVTMYLLDTENPIGKARTWGDLSEAEVKVVEQLLTAKQFTNEGCFVPNSTDWPLLDIGVEHFDGRMLRSEEITWLENCLSGTLSQNDEQFAVVDMLNRGLVLRPGFKYGCKWRAYDTGVGEAHAPWLIQPSDSAASTWEEVCLSVRLAEGVNKRWTRIEVLNDSVSYFSIRRSLPGRI